MKCSDYVAAFIEAQGIKTVFAVGGGASLHMIHSCAGRGLKMIYPHHEQAAGFAADGYARATDGLGCAIVTSGPGATNLVTAIAGAWFDSIPVLFITGQTKSQSFRAHQGVRQTGFQETDIVSMVTGITKYAVTVTRAAQLPEALEHAVHEAMDGRRGPVLVDICDDVQRDQIDATPVRCLPVRDADRFTREWSGETQETLRAIQRAARPVMVLGAGCRGAEALALRCAERWDIPIAPTWGALDLIPHKHGLYLGPWGTHGLGWVNKAVMNADLLLCVGTRLDTHMTGSNVGSLAPNAVKIIVDIDESEARARGGVTVARDALEFFTDLEIAADRDGSLIDGDPNGRCFHWMQQIYGWKREEPTLNAGVLRHFNKDPYELIEDISKALADDAQIYIDTGCALAWTCQGIKLKPGQRLVSDWNNTSMGWALPAAIGGAAATGKPTVCIVGDGAMMFNVQELQTLATSGLPITVIVIDNGGYAMCRQTQDQWFGGDYESSQASGFPSFLAAGFAFGLLSREIGHWDDSGTASKALDMFLGMSNPPPQLFVVHVDPKARVHGQVVYGKAIADVEMLEAAE